MQWFTQAAQLGPRGIESLELPLTQLTETSVFDALLNYPPIKALLPIPVLIAIAPIIIWFFRRTWQKLDAEALEYRLRAAREAGDGAAQSQPARRGRGISRRRSLRFAGRRHRSAAAPVPRLRRARADASSLPGGRRARIRTPRSVSLYARPAACLAIVAVVLTLQEYYGGRGFYNSTVRPWLGELELHSQGWVNLGKYNELYSYGWWVTARVLGYVVVPFPLWKLLFPRDSLLDMGFRIRGFLQHAWIYALCLAVVVPLVFLVAQQSDFSTYYPFYKNCSRSWLDFGIWQGIYWIQFLALEMFFRGWIVGALRPTMGAGAIFAMAVPYCMIHYGKPYLEAHAAVVAGIVLGSLAMRTRSIYAGCLVHITVAFLMDLLALLKRGALPTEFWPPG